MTVVIISVILFFLIGYEIYDKFQLSNKYHEMKMKNLKLEFKCRMLEIELEGYEHSKNFLENLNALYPDK